VLDKQDHLRYNVIKDKELISMTVREFLEKYPNVIIDDNMVFEGYGDGCLPIECCLDDEIQNYYYDKEKNYAEIYI
jgi:hypothetical protein